MRVSDCGYNFWKYLHYCYILSCSIVLLLFLRLAGRRSLVWGINWRAREELEDHVVGELIGQPGGFERRARACVEALGLAGASWR